VTGTVRPGSLELAQVSEDDGSEVSQAGRKRTDLVRRGLECGWNDRWVELSGLLHDVAGVAAGEGRNV